jgi:adenylyltransferase/sulfurtransferase
MVRGPASHGIDPGDLEALNPDCQVTLSAAAVDAAAAEEITRRHDFIIVAGAATDVTACLNLACVRSCKPFVWGSAGGSIGRVAVLAGGQPGTPCYGCLQRCSEESWTRGDPNELPGGLLGAVAAFVGTLQATAVIKLILGLEASAPGRLLTYDALAAAVREVGIAKDPRCGICGAGQPASASRS